MTSLPQHLAQLAQLCTRQVQSPPTPWRETATHAIGGLLAVGYAENTDLLLVVSSQGRGVFDCLTGEKVARDDTDPYPYFNEIKLIAHGIGPLTDRTIHIAGLHGGGLPHYTHDGWSLKAFSIMWPHHDIVLEYPYQSIYNHIDNGVKVGEDGACELRAYGFSQTGQSFIIATSCDITLFTRQDDLSSSKNDKDSR
ncbi:MAG: hypothetical protein AAGF95_29165 [Chloroflexota bacterium]